MRGRFQSLGAVVAVAAGALTVAPAGAQQTKPKPAPTPAPPVITVPAPTVPISPAPPRPPRDRNDAAIITNPSWARQPMPEYPEIATANGVTSGRVVLRCLSTPTGALTACETVSETPEGQGFAASALAAAARARLSPRTVDGAATGARIQFAIRFLMPEAEPAQPPSYGAPAPRPVIVPVTPAPALSRTPTTSVSWIRSPMVEYPERALSRGIDVGRTILQCRIAEGGVPSNCSIVFEDPAGAGFGQAALIAMRDARLSPTMEPGSLIRFPVDFRAESQQVAP